MDSGFATGVPKKLCFLGTPLRWRPGMTKVGIIGFMESLYYYCVINSSVRFARLRGGSMGIAAGV